MFMKTADGLSSSFLQDYIMIRISLRQTPAYSNANHTNRLKEGGREGRKRKFLKFHSVSKTTAFKIGRFACRVTFLFTASFIRDKDEEREVGRGRERKKSISIWVQTSSKMLSER